MSLCRRTFFRLRPEDCITITGLCQPGHITVLQRLTQRRAFGHHRPALSEQALGLTERGPGYLPRVQVAVLLDHVAGDHVSIELIGLGSGTQGFGIENARRRYSVRTPHSPAAPASAANNWW